MVLLAIILCLLALALFNGTEIAFVTASKLRVELRKNEGSRAGTILGRFYENTRSFVSTMLVGGSMALVAATYLMTWILGSSFDSLLSGNFFLFVLVLVLLIGVVVLLFGEFLPKIFFGLFPNTMLQALVYPLGFFRFLLALPVAIVTGISAFLLRYLLRTGLKEDEKIFTRIDLENFIRRAYRDQEEDIDTELFENALHFNKVKVKECMVPRKEIIAIEVTESVDALLKMFRLSGVSRIVVVDNDIDEVLGYIHHQHLLRNPRNLRSIMMPIPVVPEVMSIYDLMNKFIKERNSIACVVDEYGGTSGIITLEDILEELFGDIEDEHDQEEYLEVMISEREYLLSGRLEISYLNEKYEDLQLPEGEYTTLSGYIVMTSGTIPEQGSEILLDSFRFILEMVSDTRIETVRVIRLERE